MPRERGLAGPRVAASDAVQVPSDDQSAPRWRALRGRPCAPCPRKLRLQGDTIRGEGTLLAVGGPAHLLRSSDVSGTRAAGPAPRTHGEQRGGPAFHDSRRLRVCQQFARGLRRHVRGQRVSTGTGSVRGGRSAELAAETGGGAGVHGAARDGRLGQRGRFRAGERPVPSEEQTCREWEASSEFIQRHRSHSRV